MCEHNVLHSCTVLVNQLSFILSKLWGFLKTKTNVPDPTQWDFGFIEYYREAIALYKDPDDRSRHLHLIKYCEAQRDFHTPSLRHINHLIQIDEKPNLELREPRCEIYKISLSFQPRRKS